MGVIIVLLDHVARVGGWLSVVRVPVSDGDRDRLEPDMVVVTDFDAVRTCVTRLLVIVFVVGEPVTVSVPPCDFDTLADLDQVDSDTLELVDMLTSALAERVVDKVLVRLW